MAQDQQAINHGSSSGGQAAGAANHYKKMAKHHQQVSTGQGAGTGGLATSPGAPKVSNSAGKFLTKGKM